jgi:hypothetical protein
MGKKLSLLQGGVFLFCVRGIKGVRIRKNKKRKLSMGRRKYEKDNEDNLWCANGCFRACVYGV